MSALPITIYNYKLNEQFITELFKFSKIHQYDSQKDFKEAWVLWREYNIELVEYETRRLNSLGYNGDVNNKMYKSARYYFRTKNTEKIEPAKRKVYITSQKTLIDAIDDHIKTKLSEKNYKPSDYFERFYDDTNDAIQRQITAYNESGFTDKKEIKNKIKKTYKNRYYLISISQ